MLRCHLSEIPPNTSTPICNPGQGRLWVVGVTLAGQSEQILEGARFTMRPGDVTILKPNGCIGWRVLGHTPWKVTYAMLLPPSSWVSLLDLPESAPEYCFFPLRGSEEYKHIRQAVLDAYNHQNDVAQPWGERLAWNSIERALLWLNRTAKTTQETQDPHLDLILAYIRSHIGKPIFLSDIAKSAGVSISTMHLLFRRKFKMSPMAYVEQERMRIASEMLANTNCSVKEISIHSGYLDQRYFASRFKFHTHHSPSEFRMLHRKK